MTAELRRIRHCEPCDGSGTDPCAIGDEPNGCEHCDGQGFIVLAPVQRTEHDCHLIGGRRAKAATRLVVPS